MQSLTCASTLSKQPKIDYGAYSTSILCPSNPLTRLRHSAAAFKGARQTAPVRKPAAVRAAAQQQLQLGSLKPSNSSKAAELKAEIKRQAGSSNGTDLAPEQHGALSDLVAELESLNPAPHPASMDLTGTTWHLVYTTSTAASSGKIGPFVGLVEQEFPADQPAQYINWVSFAGGLVKAKLVADYKAAPDRDEKLNVQFIDTTFMLGPLKFRKEFDANRGGWWRLTYVDNDWRILYANTGNVFVLAR